MRGATREQAKSKVCSKISIHAPRAGGDRRGVPFLAPVIISIHAPRAGGDYIVGKFNLNQILFQSTPPVRGATIERDTATVIPADFNPRPPCGGRPGGTGGADRVHADFNPRPPCGGRLQSYVHTLPYLDFNPRPPCGGRPCELCWYSNSIRISIHAPRAGGDTPTHTPP